MLGLFYLLNLAMIFLDVTPKSLCFYMNVRIVLSIELSNDIFGCDTKIAGNKNKNKHMILHQTKKLLHSKGNHQQTNRMGENICRPYIL